MRPPVQCPALAASLAAMLFLAPAASRAQPPPFILSWGSFGTGNDQFKTPAGVAVDPQGNVYVVDTSNNRVQKFTSNGSYIAQWGAQGSGDGQFGGTGPAGIAVDRTGDVFVTDPGNQRFERFTQSGSYVLQGPTHICTGIAMDDAGDVYVANPAFGDVEKFTNGGALLLDVPVTEADGVAVDEGGNILVCSIIGTVVKLSPSGSLLLTWGSVGSGPGQFGTSGPTRLAIGRNGVIYVVDHGNSRIEVFAPDGSYISEWGSPGSGPGQFRNPIGIAIDANDNIYVADTNNSRIQKVGPLPTPAVQTSWGHLKRLYR